jgi:type I restriction enzyme S subunit
MQIEGRLLRSGTSKDKYKEPKPPDPENYPFAGLPEGWAWVSIGQLAWSVKDGPHYSPTYADEGIPFITGGNVRAEGVDFKSAKRISPELHAKLSKRCKPETGDLLYTKGGTTGIARVNTYSHEFSVWVHVAVLNLAGSIDPFYLQHALNSPLCYSQAQRYTHGVGNQDLGLTRMVNIVLGLPPLAEQRRVVAEVERRLSVVEEQERAVERSLARAGKLRQAILRRAFAGKLVPQDPSDEPASLLLERIRAERAAAGEGTRPRRGRTKRVTEPARQERLFEG